LNKTKFLSKNNKKLLKDIQSAIATQGAAISLNPYWGLATNPKLPRCVEDQEFLLSLERKDSPRIKLR
jgi:hypothetical protein